MHSSPVPSRMLKKTGAAVCVRPHLCPSIRTPSSPALVTRRCQGTPPAWKPWEGDTMNQTIRETVRRQRLAFYFDPICPFAWRASEWIRLVARSRPLDIDWRLFSLGVANGNDSMTLMMPARVLALVGRQGGQEAVGRLYQTLGRRIHEAKENVRAPGALEHTLEEGLRDAGL